MTITIDGKDKKMKEYIMDRVYIDLSKSEFIIHALIPSDNISTLSRLILFKKTGINETNGEK
jgi:hypothetical protein